ncbi:MAG: hypothetical protein V1921_02930 [Candidatus Altiarchaeota archaeon]
MARKDVRRQLTSTLGSGLEFSFYVLFFLFLGYAVGSLVGRMWGAIGMVAGATVGFLLVVFRIKKIAET